MEVKSVVFKAALYFFARPQTARLQVLTLSGSHEDLGQTSSKQANHYQQTKYSPLAVWFAQEHQVRLILCRITHWCRMWRWAAGRTGGEWSNLELIAIQRQWPEEDRLDAPKDPTSSNQQRRIRISKHWSNLSQLTGNRLQRDNQPQTLSSNRLALQKRWRKILTWQDTPTLLQNPIITKKDNLLLYQLQQTKTINFPSQTIRAHRKVLLSLAVQRPCQHWIQSHLHLLILPQELLKRALLWGIKVDVALPGKSIQTHTNCSKSIWLKS